MRRAPTTPPPPSAEITDEATFMNRRALLRLGAIGAIGAALGGCPAADEAEAEEDAGPGAAGLAKLDAKPAAARFRAEESLTTYADATSYNNFYEFGTGKRDPAANAHTLRTRPWSVVVDGECAKPGMLDIEDVVKPALLEERVYRFRCVEAWSMVVPWIGVPLATLLARFEPTSSARHVAFETLVDREQMPGQRRRVIDWPYREGLRLDEAMHPLTLMAVGLYGHVLPNQNGAPLRLVVPWKYGFKSIKSIVRISFTKDQPPTSWNDLQPSEYGYFANVNPEVDHPRWSQARERPLGKFRKQPTRPFNGYGDEVASLYAGMDLRRFY